MPLRTKLLALFGLLAVLPLLGTGIFHYVQAKRTFESHVAAQVGLIADRVAGEVERRHDVQVSDLLLLAENAETQAFFRSLSGGDADPALLAAAMAYAGAAWERYSAWYRHIQLQDATGRARIQLGEVGPDMEHRDFGERGEPAATFSLEQPILHEETGALLGRVAAWPRISEVLPREALEARFGGAGYTVVFDRSNGMVVHHPRRRFQPQVGLPVAELEFDVAAAAVGSRGTLSFHSSDTARIAAFVNVDSPPWTVVATSALDEFAAPFERMRTFSLAVVLLVGLGIAVASPLLVRRATLSLEQLTAAAEQVGRGDFSPSLPPPGRDEVGQLSRVFRQMVGRIRTMMAEIESRRQMAAVGEFASELAHEIRNPLTSVKLNLQRIDRSLHGHETPASEPQEPLRIALREIQRLERVVQGVLSLARPRALQRSPVSLHATVAEALEVVRPVADAQRVEIRARFAAAQDSVAADSEQLRAALLNLFLNAVEAMPDGGELRVFSEARRGGDGNGALIELTVADTGPGIAQEVREQLFRPFFTTKLEGTGLGLSLALRTVEEHGGRLELVEPGGEEGGVFRLTLPLTSALIPA
jgi:two-component system, NtrC family, sensor kinase